MDNQTNYNFLKNEVNDYEQTVKALLAFSSLIIHDGIRERMGSNFGFGRKMHTTMQNKISKANEITPDLIAQKSLTYGIVGEVKKSLPENQKHWDKYIDQINKYDDDLEGWWTDNEKIIISDPILLIHLSRSRALKLYIEQKQIENTEFISKNATIVEFGSSDENTPFYFFRLEYGEIRDKELSDDLKIGVNVPLNKVLESYSNINYYDSEPPIVLILINLWTDVLPSKIIDENRDEKSNAFRIKVSVEEITDELQQAYGSKNENLYTDERSVEFPKYRWIKRAFEELVRFKLAIPPKDGNNEYEVHYKPFKRSSDVKDRFIHLCLADSIKKDKNSQKQYPLFDDEENIF